MNVAYVDLEQGYNRRLVHVERAVPIGCGYDRAGQPYIIFKGVDCDGNRWTFRAVGYVPASNEYFCDAYAPIRPHFRMGDRVRMFREAYPDSRYANYGMRVGTIAYIDRRHRSWRHYEPTWIRVAYPNGDYGFFKPTELEPVHEFVGAYPE